MSTTLEPAPSMHKSETKHYPSLPPTLNTCEGRQSHWSTRDRIRSDDDVINESSSGNVKLVIVTTTTTVQ